MNTVYWLLATTALVVSTFAQTPNGTRKAWNDTLWIDRDGTYQLVGDYIDTQNQSTLQFKDTTALKAASFDSVGFVVNLKQLSSANTLGGGSFVSLDSAAARTQWGAGIVADGVSFQSATAGERWFRKEMLEQGILRPEWFGAVMDGSTDDYTPISTTVSHAWALGYPVILREGIYKIDSELDITNPSSTSGNKVGIDIRGTVGANTNGRTRLLFAAGLSPSILIDGTTIAGTRVYNTYLSDLSISSSGLTKVDTCLKISDLTTGRFRNIDMNGYLLGLNLTDSDNLVFEQVQGAGVFGASINGNANGNLFLECAFTGNDSIGVRLSSCYGNIFVGGDRGNQYASFEGVTTCNFTIYGGNFESHDSAAIILNDNSNATVVNARFLKGTPDGLVAELNNTTHIDFYGLTTSGWGATDSIVSAANSGCTAQLFGQNENVTYYWWNETNSEKYVMTDMNFIRATTGLDNGKLYWKQNGVNGTTALEGLLFSAKVQGTAHTFRLYEQPQFRWDLNLDPALPVRKSRTRVVEGYKTFLSVAGDSTPVTVVFNNVNDAEDILYWDAGNVFKTTGTKLTDAYVTTRFDPTTVVADSITFLVWHKANASLDYDPTAGGVALGFTYKVTFIDSTSWGD